MRTTTIVGFHPLWGNADYFNGALYDPAQAVQVNPTTGNVILGTGNAYNGVVIPGLSGFPNSAQGRVLAASANICDGGPCAGLFAPNLPQSYINTYTPVQPRLGVAYQIDSKTVIRAGVGRFVTRMGLLDNVFAGRQLSVPAVRDGEQRLRGQSGSITDQRNRGAAHHHHA